MCVHIYVRIYIHTYIHTYIHSYSYIYVDWFSVLPRGGTCGIYISTYIHISIAIACCNV